MEKPLTLPHPGDPAKPAPTDDQVRATTVLAQEMFENYEKKIFMLGDQLKLMRILTSTVELDKLVDALLHACQGSLLVSTAAIFLPPDLDNTGYGLRACAGEDLPAQRPSFSAASPLIRLFRKGGAWLRYESFATKPAFRTVAEKLKLLRPEVLAPLRAREDLIGFLVFSRKFSGQDFTESDLQQIAFIAEVAGVLIENARLYEMATHDRMSGLFVNHYFKNALYAEFNRARRYRKPLALVMADIDHFKKINDTWGHQKGDQVIQEIAAILKSGIREIDILARYGGEEFALILPETALESASTVAERLREMVEEHRFVDEADPVPVTASFGVAVLQRRFGSSEELIKAADDALYAAKRGGRNRVAR